MQDLIARLSEATGPDRELDCEIALQVGYRKWIDDDGDHRGYEHTAKNGVVHLGSEATLIPAYTASLDAAMTLVPVDDGWWAEVHIRPDAPGVVLHQFPLPCRRVPAESPYQIAGRTATLALCIAALKARMKP